MPRSMTGFSRHESQQPWGTITWEIRSVNHRYLEPHFRLPENARALETHLREKLRHRLQRGKIEVNLQLHMGSDDNHLAVNTKLAQQIIAAADQLNQMMVNAAPIDPLEVLRWPGVMEEATIDTELFNKSLLEEFDCALTGLVEHREREGKELSTLIEQRLVGVSEQVKLVRERLPEIAANQRQKLTTKIEELSVEIDKERLEQEIVYLANKSDVDEELDRLDTHVTEVRNCLKQKGGIGRRLDFLMQELNREANTLSSKATVSDTTQAAVELKVLIEQMREQVQNIE
ncbi:YicC/YloC family endoribonuclease [Marinibactrum halimedae]|uniref:YicC family protein n=1 Tax=Marinibactrum halimedae TaxID=1444977 RepID=A0AA37T7C8_9GAMM|nr:YicC/YloC family endoribonuclease [Marinibactrum halimedae]MCD9458221.1 YicC family protein [Marinibactrum halimedae]GLS27151.1 hypothetical protein GCM10007877_28700 [Marinibactrum halimedae]